MRTFPEKDTNRFKIHKSAIRLPQKWKTEVFLGAQAGASPAMVLG